VTRIIAGAARGLGLAVPDAGTRPTSDRVRESLFGSLETHGLIDGARVLDLYAGSGALGLESASRGASAVDLVEKARGAAAVASRNASGVAKATGVSARVHQSGVLPFLRSTSLVWDLVFIDPPYDVNEAEIGDVLAALAPRLSPEAVVIVERAKRSPAPEWSVAGMSPMRDKTYGDTTVWWGELSSD